MAWVGTGTLLTQATVKEMPEELVGTDPLPRTGCPRALAQQEATTPTGEHKQDFSIASERLTHHRA